MTKPLLVSPPFFDRCRAFLGHVTSEALEHDTAGDLKTRVRGIFEATSCPVLPRGRFLEDFARLPLQTHRACIVDSTLALIDRPTLKRRRQFVDVVYTYANRPDREPMP